MFYSKSAGGLVGGFYSREIHGDKIPSDVVEITDAEHAALLEGQALGKRIVVDASGRPMLAEPPAPTAEQLATTIRADRDTLIAATAWRYERYARETRLGLPTTDDIAVLDTYIQKLADVPTQAGFPVSVEYPEPLQ